MKYFIGLIGVCILIISCHETSFDFNEDFNEIAISRCPVLCDDYSYSIEIIEEENCCITILTVENYCGSLVTSDRNSPGSFENQPLIPPTEINNQNTGIYIFSLCIGEEPYNIYLLPTKEVEDVDFCEIIPIAECDPDCCEKVLLDLLSIENKNGCCLYNIEVENDSDCAVEFGTNSVNSSNITVPMGTSNYQVSPCRGNADQAFVLADGLVCKTINLTETCISCCEFGSVEIIYGGGEETDDGCCLYKPRVTNNSSCTIKIKLGETEFTLSPGEWKYVFFKVCPPDTEISSEILYFSDNVILQVVNDLGEVCLEEIFDTNCN